MRSFLFALTLIISTNTYGQHVLIQEESEWLKKHVISYPSNINEVSDEEWERISIPNETRIVGLGEANHGTKEFHILNESFMSFTR